MMRAALADVSALPLASSTETTDWLVVLRTSTRYFQGGIDSELLKSLLKKPGYFLPSPGST